jgi:hypothetical protein
MEQLTLVDHPPQSTVEAPRLSVPTRKVAVLDRIALRLGLALIVWSRRRDSKRPNREQLRANHAHYVATARREREVERSVLLTVPHR